TDALERIADYGTRLRNGMRAVLGARGIAHSFVGHPSMSGLYFAHEPPRNYRAWKGSDYSFYDAMAKVLHDEGVLCEPDSREPWFVSAAPDASCLPATWKGFATLVGGGGTKVWVAAFFPPCAAPKVLVPGPQPYIGGAAVSRRLYQDFT